MGSFTEKPLPDIHCSPLVQASKKTVGEYRMIHHLLYPEGKSVNDGIPEEGSFVQYSSDEDAIQIFLIPRVTNAETIFKTINCVERDRIVKKTDISKCVSNYQFTCIAV